MREDKEPITLEEASQLLAQARALSDRVATYNQRVVGEGDSLAAEVTELRNEVLGALGRMGEGADEVVDELRRAKGVVEGHGPGGDLRKLCKQKSPALLRLLVGARTNVVTIQRNESIKLKEEYHAFRDRAGVLLFSFSCALLLVDYARPHNHPFSLTPPFMVAVQLFLCWLLYVYTALALRENVLKVNGSGIRPWWIQHHYWSIATCMLVLTLPVDSISVQLFVKKWLWWSLFQGLVMMLQNRYQRRRMYTRIALGKNRAMDVVSGESSGGTGQLLILYPLLFGLQLYQCTIGVEMFVGTVTALASPEGWLDLEAHESDLRGSRGVAIAGAMMLLMGVFNFKNTVATILDKRGRRKAIHNAALGPVAQESGAVEKSADDKSPVSLKDKANETPENAKTPSDGQHVAKNGDEPT